MKITQRLLDPNISVDHLKVVEVLKCRWKVGNAVQIFDEIFFKDF